MIHYDQLFFPEVEDLPRHWPVVIPLGGTPEQHQRQLGLEEAILMPAVPYGFAPPLELPLEPLLTSLVHLLHQDGFHDIRILGPRAYCGLPTLPFVPDSLALVTETAVVPIGHTEQHGFHLPLATDSLIAQGLADHLMGYARPMSRLPVWPYGVSTHRKQYPGTLSLEPRAFEDFFVALAGQLAATHQVIYLLNGHGGNHSFLVNVCKFAGELFTQALTATTFLHTASGHAEAELTRLRESKVMGHACELETSYLMFLHPQRVHLDRAVDEADFLESPNYRMDWNGEGALILNPPWSDDTRTGTYGSPSLASAVKGQAWLEAGAAEVVTHLHELRQQWQRRQQRRQQGWTEGAWRPLWSTRQRDQANAHKNH
ncbi:creatininase family protein [bacterium]|nr:creatininase family protein [bacterium]